MPVSRRTMLAYAGGAAALPLVAPASVPPPSIGQPRFAPRPALSPAFRRVVEESADYGRREIEAWGLPGMTLCLRSPLRETAIVSIGRASFTPDQPVRPEQLFQIGSISKSICAIALLHLQAQGRIRLGQSVREAMPDLPVDDPRVTFDQVLDHTAGFPNASPPFPRVPGHGLWSQTEPGKAWCYSNPGYDLLAWVIERASGLPFDRAIRTLVFDPLGMTAAQPTIRTRDRWRYAQGYIPFRDDVPRYPEIALAEGPWMDIDRAAGSVAATPADMLRYIAFVGRCARGDGSPLFGAAEAKRLTTPVIAAFEFGPDARYGSGLATVMIDGRPALHHTGGMLMFSSSVHVEPTSGAGAFASVNARSGGYRPRNTTRYAVMLMRAMSGGGAAPTPPKIVPVPPVPSPSDYAGQWFGPGGRAIEIVADGDQCAVVVGGVRGRMQLAGDGAFAPDHPALAGRLLEFASAKGARDTLWIGGDRFGRGAAPVQPAVPDRLRGLEGSYGSTDPWAGGADLFARGDRLWFEGAGELREAADGSWRMAETADNPVGNERLWFEAFASGRAQRVNLSGQGLIRMVA